MKEQIPSERVGDQESLVVLGNFLEWKIILSLKLEDDIEFNMLIK